MGNKWVVSTKYRQEIGNPYNKWETSNCICYNVQAIVQTHVHKECKRYYTQVADEQLLQYMGNKWALVTMRSKQHMGNCYNR